MRSRRRRCASAWMGGFAGNDWLDVLETERVEYVVGLASNPRLERRAGRLLGEAYGLSKYSGRVLSTSTGRRAMRPRAGRPADT